MENLTFQLIFKFFNELPVGHQLTIVAKKANSYEVAVNVGPATGGPIDAYHVDCSVTDAPIDLCLCDETFEGADGTYIVDTHGWRNLEENE